MATKIVFANKKGGVGKTTSTVNVAAFLAAFGYRVLAIDMDPQSHLTIGFGVDYRTLEKSIKEVFESKMSLSEAAIKVFPNLDIIPARPDLIEIMDIASIVNHRLRNEIIKFKLPGVEKLYDYILIDTPPAEPHIFTLNSLAAADFVIIPIQLERYPIEGLTQMLDILADVKTRWLNPDIEILGILGSFYQNTVNCREHLSMLEDIASTGSVRLFRTKIRRNVALSAAVNKGVPIPVYDRKSNGYKDYRNLTLELLTYLSPLVIFDVKEELKP